MSSVTSEQGQSPPDESAPPAPVPGRRSASWAGWLVVGLYLVASFALTWRLWADPAGRMVADTALAAAVMVAVLVLGHPRVAVAAVRTRAQAMLEGLGVAIGVMALTCGATIAPAQDGRATSYVDHLRPTVKYLQTLYYGLPGGHAPSRAQLRADLAYWQPAAIVAVTTMNTPLGRYLTAEFGPPTVQVGDMLAWKQPVLQALPGRLAPLRGKGRVCLAWRRSSLPAEPGSSARIFANGC